MASSSNGIWRYKSSSGTTVNQIDVKCTVSNGYINISGSNANYAQNESGKTYYWFMLGEATD